MYGEAVPFNQFSTAAEQPTGADGWATLTMSREAGYPATRNQQLLVIFARARKAGEDLLGGVSTRRLGLVPGRPQALAEDRTAPRRDPRPAGPVCEDRGVSHLRLIDVDEATGPLKEEYDAAIGRAGKVYNIVKSMSLRPDV